VPAIIAAIGTGVAVVLGAYNKVSLSMANRRIESIKKTGEATHTLGNSAMGAQILTRVESLKASAIIAHRLAVVTGQEADLTVAKALDVQVESALREFHDHQTKQAVVDAQINFNGGLTS
jgi:hypothetical protein